MSAVIDRINTRIKEIEDEIRVLDVKAARETDETQRRETERRLYTLRQNLPILLFAAGREAEINPRGEELIGSFHMEDKDLTLLPVGPIYLDRGGNGDTFMTLVESPASNGRIVVERQTRGGGTLVMAGRSAELPAPYFCTFNIQGLTNARVLPDEIQEFVQVVPSSARVPTFRVKIRKHPTDETLNALIEAHRVIPDYLRFDGFVSDGWVVLTTKSIEMAATCPYWDRKACFGR